MLRFFLGLGLSGARGFFAGLMLPRASDFLLLVLCWGLVLSEA